GFQPAQCSVQFNFSIELFLTLQLRSDSVYFALLSLYLLGALQQLCQRLLGARNQGAKVIHQLFIKHAKIQCHRKRLTRRTLRLPICFEVAPYHQGATARITFGFLRGPLISCNQFYTSTLYQLKNQRKRNSAVDGFEHLMVQTGTLEAETKHVDLCHRRRSWQIDRFRGQFVGPVDLLYLQDKAFLEGGTDGSMLVYLALGHHPAKGRLFRPGKQRHSALPSMTRNAISSKSSSPCIVAVRAVVRPPPNRLSMSFSSFTSIMLRMAWLSRSE